MNTSMATMAPGWAPVIRPVGADSLPNSSSSTDSSIPSGYWKLAERPRSLRKPTPLGEQDELRDSHRREEQRGVFLEVEKLALRRDTIVTVLAILVIAIALPFAIVDTFQTGRVYLFSRQFLEELPQRFTGPGRLRFILQPMVAIVLGIRGGLADVKAGNPPYLFGLLFGAERRGELLRSGVAAIRNLLALGIIMDIVFHNWPFTTRCIRAQPCWLGRFLFASPTHSPEH